MQKVEVRVPSSASNDGRRLQVGRGRERRGDRRRGTGRCSTASCASATSSRPGSARTVTRRSQLFPPQAGERVLDIGCGFGDTTQQIAGARRARAARRSGVDAAADFIEAARREAAEAGVGNARFLVADVETTTLGGPLRPRLLAHGDDVLRQPGGRAAQRARGARARRRSWRWSCGAAASDNDWLYRAQTIVEGIVSGPRSTTSRRAGPGRSRWPTPTRRATCCCTPASRTSRSAAATSPILIGSDVDEAIDLSWPRPRRRDPAPAGRARGAPAWRGDAALREGLAEFARPDGRSARRPRPGSSRRPLPERIPGVSGYHRG